MGILWRGRRTSSAAVCQSAEWYLWIYCKNFISTTYLRHHVRLRSGVFIRSGILGRRKVSLLGVVSLFGVVHLFGVVSLFEVVSLLGVVSLFDTSMSLREEKKIYDSWVSSNKEGESKVEKEKKKKNSKKKDALPEISVKDFEEGIRLREDAFNLPILNSLPKAGNYGVYMCKSEDEIRQLIEQFGGTQQEKVLV